MIRTFWTSSGEQLNFETPIQLDVVGGWVVCDVCAKILSSTDTIPYCDYKCNLKVVKKKDKATSKKAKII